MGKVTIASKSGRVAEPRGKAASMGMNPLFRAAWVLAVLAALGSGCTLTAPRFSGSPRYTDGPAPLRERGPGPVVDARGFEAEVSGGQLFQMYCNYCHVRRQLSERPFSNTQNTFAHMRARANLTGVEYEKLIDWLQKIDDVPKGTPEPEPSPKRLIYSQPINELRPAAEPAAAAPAVPANTEPVNPPLPPS